MRTVLRVVALLMLAAVAADTYLLTHHNRPLLVAGCLLVAGAAIWREAVVPAALAAGSLYVVGLLVGHVPYDAGAAFVGAALVAYVNVSAWSAATPRHATVPVRSLALLVAQQLAALTVGVGMALLVVAGRSQAARPSPIPWLAGLATLFVALLVPTLRGGGRRDGPR
ncbi:MAG: hypothetical protein QOK14_1151 [Frankiaceae bacterium]|jgi:hypothetical protein|nr:hypothetical protein [Frankiaceae bacterium]